MRELYAPNHERISAALALQSGLGALLLMGASWGVCALQASWSAPILLVLSALQGLWLYRLYVVGHESVHKRLFPDRPWLNDVTGALLLLPLMIPLNVYRKIHRFHHSHNRLDAHTSALETWPGRGPPSPARRAWAWTCWLLAVWAGGWFLHGLVSILLFLFVPPSLAPRISPAFQGWRWRDQLGAIAGFGLGAAFHGAVIFGLGASAWGWMLGAPLAFFAWIYSLFLYIYHYRTPYGPPVGRNARSLEQHWLFSWLLLNFNQHTTHHSDPQIPWYSLPAAARERGHAPDPAVRTLGAAVLHQLQGPVFMEEP